MTDASKQLSCLFATVVFLVVPHQRGSLAQEAMPWAATANNSTGYARNTKNVFDQEPLPRIIGGSDTEMGRYPYFVSLLNQDGVHSCGGTLVAPDVVMSAAHCADSVKYAQVGRWNRVDSNDDYEEFDIVTPLHLHPLYQSGTSFSNDVMLIKLNRQSTKQYLRINENPDLPTGQQPDELTAIGIGYTKDADASSAPQVLQEASLSYVPPYICERSKDPSIVENYQGLISEDMLCASDDGEDTCQGDSGGPLLLNTGTGMDLLVGVVSWGFECASPSFPGVYSRVSYHSEWAKSTLCEISHNPPLEYDCANVAIADEDSVPVTIAIKFDDHPEEVTWSLVRKETETVLVSVEAGTYTGAQSSVQETVFLSAGSNVIFKIQDQYGDGLCCDPPGHYRVVLGRNVEGLILVSGGGDFGHEKWHDFQVPLNFVDDEEKPNLAEGEIPLTVVVQLDDFPQEVGWRVDRLGVHVEEVIRIPAGIYTTPEMKVIRTVILQHGELYCFSLYDMTQNGIKNGFVQLYLGNTNVDDSSGMIFESDGNFVAGVDHTFIAVPLDGTTSAPVMPSEAHLTLELRMDLYPAEVSVQLRMHADEASVSRQTDRGDPIVFFRPPGYYKDRVNEVVTERIAIPAGTPGERRTFTFIITDRYGDGLCCASMGELETGYTIYEGDRSTDRVIVQSKFEKLGREVQVFIIDSNGMDGTDSEPLEFPGTSIVVKVTINLDFYPDETGFYIDDDTGRRVVDVPPGTYSEQNGIVTEVVTLEIGLYTFTILDVFGDGLNRADCFYMLEVVDERIQPPLLIGTGAFASRESQAFLLEGEAAQYPMSIHIPTGTKPRDFGIFIYRLDLIGADALIASIVQGSDEYAKEQIVESLAITEGGLYRIVFENTAKGAVGGIRIILGDANPDASNAIEYTTRAEDTQDSRRWHMKFYAGVPPSPTANIGNTLTLRARFDRFPNEIEWILVANNNFTLQASSQRQVERQVIAFGPAAVYGPDLGNAMYEEKIIVPEHTGNKSFTLIVTDSGKDGICCSFGDGGPLELYDGTPEVGILLVSDPLQGEDRFVANFYLLRSGSCELRWGWIFGLVVLLSATIIVT